MKSSFFQKSDTSICTWKDSHCGDTTNLNCNCTRLVNFSDFIRNFDFLSCFSLFALHLMWDEWRQSQTFLAKITRDGKIALLFDHHTQLWNALIHSALIKQASFFYQEWPSTQSVVPGHFQGSNPCMFEMVEDWMWVCRLVSEWRSERSCLTTILHGFIRPVFAVLHTVTHLAAVDTLSVFTAELSWSFTFCNCVQNENCTHDLKKK